MLPAKDHVALWAVQRLPQSDTSLQGAADFGREAGVSALQLAQDGDGAQARVRPDAADLQALMADNDAVLPELHQAAFWLG